MKKVIVIVGLLSSLPAFAQGTPPGYATIQRLCKQRHEMRGVKSHSQGVAIGDGRFLSVVHHHDKKKSQWMLDLVQLQKRGGSWALTGRWPLPMKSAIRGGNKYSPASLCTIDAQEWKPASALFVKDYDKDGKPEALVSIKFCWMVPAIGGMSIRTMQLFNIGKEGVDKKAAFSFEIDQDGGPTSMGRTLARYTFEDLDGDQHPDLRLRISSTYPDHVKDETLECTERWERHFLWQQATDRYLDKKSKQKRRKRRCKKPE